MRSETRRQFSGSAVGLVLLVVSVLMSGCATTAQTPPEAAVRAEVGLPSPGTKWVSRTTDHTGASATRTWTVLEEGSYAGRSVSRLSDGTDVILLDKGTWNWIATLRAGKERFSASPHDATFSSPLWVGKSWQASYAYADHERGLNWPSVQTMWKVEAYEEVTTPAGTFRAFRLQSEAGVNNALNLTIWYAPGPRLVVKQVVERTTGHYLGLGKSTTEVVEHPAK